MKNRWNGIRLLTQALALLAIATLLVAGATGQALAKSKKGKPQIAFYAFNSEPILDWDPAVMFSNGIVVLNNVYETLLRYNSLSDKVDPLLAESYSSSKDGLTWTFNLRRGVTFHDGTAFTAEAVKLSIDRTIQMGKGAAYIWDPVKSITVVDDFTVRFDLKYAAPLDLIASSGYAAFIISPKALKSHPDSWFSKGNEAGTGPYALRSYKMGDEVILKAYPKYWRGWEKKHFDIVVIKKVAETSSRRQMIEKGESDITIELPYEDVNVLKTSPRVEVVVEPSYQNLLLFFNTQKGALQNKTLRQALSYAFPYDDVIKYAMGGYATQGRGPIPEGHWGHGKDLFQYEYNLDKAKELLAKAGYPDGGLKLLMTYMSGDEAEKKTAEMYKSKLLKLNVDLEVRGMPWDSQWEMAKSSNIDKRQDIMLMYWWPDFSSPYSWLYNLYHSQDAPLFNMSYMANKAFDQMIDDANEMSGISKQKSEQLFIEAQKLLVEEAASIYPYDKQFVWVKNKRFKGHTGNPIYPNVVFFYDTYRD